MIDKQVRKDLKKLRLDMDKWFDKMDKEIKGKSCKKVRGKRKCKFNYEKHTGFSKPNWGE